MVGVQKRISPDLVEEIEECEGGTFSEKLLKWKEKSDYEDEFGSIEESIERLERKLETATGR